MATKLNIVASKEMYGDNCRDIHNTLVDEELYSYYGDTLFGYFSEWDDNSEHECIDGAVDPDALVKFCQNWAGKYKTEIAGIIDGLAGKTGSAGGTTGTLVANCKDRQRLGGLLLALEGTFTCEVNRLYAGEDGGFSTLIPPEEEEKIKKHPERYAVIATFYH